MRALEIILEMFFCSFSSLFQIFFVKRPDDMFGDVRTVILNIRTDILVVRTIRFLCPDVFGSRPDGCVFTTVYVAQRLDGEPCRVKSLYPRTVAHFFTSFG
jgi:hypothetical protein